MALLGGLVLALFWNSSLRQKEEVSIATLNGHLRACPMPYFIELTETDWRLIYEHQFERNLRLQSSPNEFVDFLTKSGLKVSKVNGVLMIFSPRFILSDNDNYDRMIDGFTFRGDYMILTKFLENQFPHVMLTTMAGSYGGEVYEMTYTGMVSLRQILLDLAAKYELCSEAIIALPNKHVPPDASGTPHVISGANFTIFKR